MGVLFWFVLKAILSSLIGQAFYGWFKTTKYGAWWDKKITGWLNKVTRKQHGLTAMRYSLTFLFLFVIAFIHAILPCLFKNTASDIVCEMSEHMECRKGK